jgi:hypothetical protein
MALPTSACAPPATQTHLAFWKTAVNEEVEELFDVTIINILGDLFQK